MQENIQKMSSISCMVHFNYTPKRCRGDQSLISRNYCGNQESLCIVKWWMTVSAEGSCGRSVTSFPKSCLHLSQFCVLSPLWQGFCQPFPAEGVNMSYFKSNSTIKRESKLKTAIRLISLQSDVSNGKYDAAN